MSGYKVQVEIGIDAGRTFTISDGHKYGYSMGAGTVNVTKVVSGPAMDKDFVLSWMEIHTQAMDSSDKYEHRMEILKDVYRFCTEPWVYFSYVDGSDTIEIPAYLFAQVVVGVG